jgi:hypothetical protein
MVQGVEQRDDVARAPLRQPLEGPAWVATPSFIAASALPSSHTPCWTASAASLISIATVRATTSPGVSASASGVKPSAASQAPACVRHAVPALGATA